jgi:hypothetical protein
VAADVTAGASPYDQAVGLRSVVGDRHGFRGYGDDYGDLRASLLHEVVERRRGLPILLSVVYLDVARRAGIPAYGVGLPGHFVVAVGEPESATLLDPYAGGRLTSLAGAVDTGARRRGSDGRSRHCVGSRSRSSRGCSTTSACSPPGPATCAPGSGRPTCPCCCRPTTSSCAGSAASCAPGSATTWGAAHDLEQYAEAVAGTDDDRAEEALGEARMVRSRLN